MSGVVEELVNDEVFGVVVSMRGEES